MTHSHTDTHVHTCRLVVTKEHKECHHVLVVFIEHIDKVSIVYLYTLLHVGIAHIHDYLLPG